MKRRTRIQYTEADKALMWERWRQGESLHAISSSLQSLPVQRVRLMPHPSRSRPSVSPPLSTFDVNVCKRPIADINVCFSLILNVAG
jgi:hypothetical protein